jgi:hypothetical protein
VKAAYHIVKSLGFKIVEVEFDGIHEVEPKDFSTMHYIGLATIDGKHTVTALGGQTEKTILFEGISNPKTFLEALFTKTTGFYISVEGFYVSSTYRIIPNPFFGCKSIEEALVIADLHFQNG